MTSKKPAKVKTRFFQMPRMGDAVKRFGLLAVLAYFAGFYVMGIVSTQESIQKAASRNLPISPVPFSLQGSTIERAQGLHRLLWHQLTHVPEQCSDSSRAANDFQRMQCGEFWGRLSELGWVGAIPFAFAAIFLFVALDGVRQRYRKARQRIQDNRSIGLAVVTDPPEAPGDRVAWWYGVQPITVQVADGKQVVAYLPPEAPTPPAGEKVTLYDWGKIGGRKRYFAVLYAPHVAVIKGG